MISRGLLWMRICLKPGKNMEFVKKIVFDGDDLVGVVDLLNLHKEELPTEDLIQLKKEHSEKKEGAAKFEVMPALISKILALAFCLVGECLAILVENILIVSEVQKCQMFCSIKLNC
jgi:hypothetical protein